MTAITYICTLDYVAKMMGEDLKLLEAIVWNDDNLTYSSIIRVHTDTYETITALIDMLRDARITIESWHQFLDDFVHDAELVVRIKALSPR